MLHTSLVLQRHINMLASIAILGLLGSTFAALSPAVNKVEDSHAAPVQSETTLAMTTPSASLSLKVEDTDGTFVASDPSDFTVTTNNYTGYTLNISAKVDDENSTKLVNGNYALDSIETATADGTGFSAGDWGYKPSKIDSADNTDFLPAPTYEGSIINATNSANSTADAYSLAIAAKADYSTTVGTYSNIFVLTAVPNPVNYTITYDKNTTDNVTNMPATQVGTLSDQDVIISSTVPSRAGYNFDGWCDGDVTTASGAQSCSGTEYNPGAVYAASMQTANTLSLKAVWNVAGTAKAILGSNGNLNFVYDDNNYITGNTYTDNLGSTTISAVYDVPTNSTDANKPAWVGSSSDYRTDITSVNFSQSFSSFKPTSTAYWFTDDRSITTMTNLSYLNTSSVTDMAYMFYDTGYSASTFSLNLSFWDVSNVTNMYCMFCSSGYNASTYSLDFNSWDVSSVTDMSFMFYYAGYKATSWSVGNIGDWGGKTSKVTSMYCMFYGSGYNASTFSLDFSSWDVSSVTNMSYMFYYAGGNASTFSLSLSSWDVSNVTNMSYMFSYAGHSASSWSVGDIGSWGNKTSKVTNMSHMFDRAGAAYLDSALSLDLSSWDVSSVTDMSSMFFWIGYRASAVSLDLSSWDVSSVTDMSYMFDETGNYSGSLSISGLNSWNVSNVTNMSWMFASVGKAATSWSIGDLSSWDVSSVTNMYQMFNGAGRATKSWSIGDLSSWNVSNVTNMAGMFSQAGYSATSWSVGNIGNWGSKTSKVTSMSGMFSSAGWTASVFSLDLSSWDVSNVTNMSRMFMHAGRNATSWSIGNLSSWNVSNVTSMDSMFSYAGYNATSWSIGNLSSWNVSNVTNMSYMFYYAGYNATYTLDLHSWNVPKVTNHTNFNGGVTTKVLAPTWPS